MNLHLRQALRDMRNNPLLNAATVTTIAMAVMIVSAFALFFCNASDWLNAWRQGVRLMVYLEEDGPSARRSQIQQDLEQMAEVKAVRFVSKDEAMDRLRSQMAGQAALLDGLDENPLPAAFEVALNGGNEQRVDALAGRIQALDGIEDVDYGRDWLKRFAGLIALFRLVGYALGGLFSLAAVFFVANTIRLTLYSRQEEVAIMRLVGATERFIRAPFYIVALLQGAIGGLLGLSALYLAYLAAVGNVSATLVGWGFSFRFLPWTAGASAVAAAMVVGWLGCFLSLKQFVASS
jgi:cell division transport system permease protein